MTDLSAKDKALLALREHGPQTAKVLGVHANTMSRLRVEELVRVAAKQPSGGRTAMLYALTRSGAARARKLAGAR
jgi:predicted ArsR family transcriptional regulator